MTAHAELSNADAGELAWRISDEIGRLSVDIADVVGDVQQVSRLIDSQTEQFHVIADATKEIVASNLQIAGMAAETQRMAKQAHHDVDASHGELTKSLTDIGELVEAVKAIGDQLAAFETAMQSVAKVSAEIGQIARHTNILSLNATIEAARAGEAGRGFAVVAHEVKALAKQTSGATDEIARTLAALTTQMKQLGERMSAGMQSTERVRQSATTISTAMQTVGEAVTRVDQNADSIARMTETIGQQAGSFGQTVQDLNAGVDQSNAALKAASTRIDRTLTGAESIMMLTATSGFETADSKFIAAAVEVARQIEQVFADAVVRGEIRVDDLFDKQLQPIQGSDPVQYMTRYIPFLDRVLPQLHDPIMALDERMVFCATTDHNQLIPTHNPKFRQPLSSDPIWNAAHCRNRRQYLDKTAQAVARSTAPFLLQTYRRDMGGGVFVLMKDASAPIRIDGRLWGGLRVCYKA
ncbi:methyl-accepting chemotaxis protein [Ferrovibrio terrae]|uniref:Methyl-accepting chemotaxis protein n=1 Tax=Ferrovibrio terrae TaxID=2594003 RepID=A0A516H0M5_9PROT|nr:methyl-accepting chemotaxis protein [Ferrovibrio terrae]QDO97130.1 methyl-accepting chemotaxis protein [Ferrovibrio terrae]